MNFEYSDEQALLSDAVTRFVSDRYGLAGVRSAAETKDGVTAANWQGMADMGLLGMPFPEQAGGFGGGPVETQIVMEAFGRGHVLDPWVGGVLLPGALLSALDPARLTELVPDVATGDLVLALAHEEDGARYVTAQVVTNARRCGNGWRLSGRKVNVLAGAAANRLFVTARTAGAEADEDGISVFEVPVDAPGLSRTAYRQYDGQTVAALTLDDVSLPDGALVGDEGEAFSALELALDTATAAICAEAVGATETMLHATVDYLKTRQQFGGPLSRFQVLQHRCAEMYVAVEQARSMALYAAVSLGLEDRDERRRAISAAKVQCAESARFAGQNAVQMHGGIGVTDELLVGHLFRRTTMIERQFGDAGHHLARLDRLGGLDNQMGE
ncbi:acyl-CoA dehydrogenase family protein [Tropicimonas isoalkanivorans]|uniref:Acyl-CoA dehydrogenase n=1 Tax=Tropicimonas isoalkanivorans TaxID=441112 RepID=A0A1I1HVD5_9RHOB|nr:acyl-CoA dehydrogenase family protein [Tropicimonas isoalkanivorans]SFC27884.1 Acyl-CoA dehydrogenase [Tropicimonas isoalkanivorans]